MNHVKGTMALSLHLQLIGFGPLTTNIIDKDAFKTINFGGVETQLFSFLKSGVVIYKLSTYIHSDFLRPNI